MSFSEDHPRICALEWLITRLAVGECMQQSDPIAAAEKLQADGEAYGMEMIGHTIGGPADQMLTAVQISAAVSSLMEEVAAEVVLEITNHHSGRTR